MKNGFFFTPPRHINPLGDQQPQPQLIQPDNAANQPGGNLVIGAGIPVVNLQPAFNTPPQVAPEVFVTPPHVANGGALMLGAQQHNAQGVFVTPPHVANGGTLMLGVQQHNVVTLHSVASSNNSTSFNTTGISYISSAAHSLSSNSSLGDLNGMSIHGYGHNHLNQTENDDYDDEFMPYPNQDLVQSTRSMSPVATSSDYYEDEDEDEDDYAMYSNLHRSLKRTADESALNHKFNDAMIENGINPHSSDEESNDSRDSKRSRLESNEDSIDDEAYFAELATMLDDVDVVVEDVAVDVVEDAAVNIEVAAPATPLTLPQTRTPLGTIDRAYMQQPATPITANRLATLFEDDENHAPNNTPNVDIASLIKAGDLLSGEESDLDLSFFDNDA